VTAHHLSSIPLTLVIKRVDNSFHIAAGVRGTVAGKLSGLADAKSSDTSFLPRACALLPLSHAIRYRPTVYPGAREPTNRGSNDRPEIYLGVKQCILTPDFLERNIFR